MTKSLTLNGDLLCSGNGLTVSGTSVILNLNGHTIFGNVGFIGILVTGTTDTVKNGVVGLFSYGVEVQGTTDTVSTVQALFNQVGIADSGTSTKLTGDTAARNSADGIDSGAAGIAVYSGDHELSNAFNGLSFTGTAKITISSNVAESNGQYGISGGGGTLTNNVADFNGFDGIHIQSLGVTLDGGGNVAKGNNWVAGQKPYQCEQFPCS